MLAGLFGWLDVLIEAPLGRGLGIGHQQAGVFLGNESGFSAGIEEELSRAALELGVVGFFAMLYFKVAAIAAAVRYCLKYQRTKDAQLIAIPCSVLIVLLTGGLYTPLANVLTLTAVGVIAAMTKHAGVVRDVRLGALR